MFDSWYLGGVFGQRGLDAVCLITPRFTAYLGEEARLSRRDISGADQSAVFCEHADRLPGFMSGIMTELGKKRRPLRSLPAPTIVLLIILFSIGNLFGKSS